MCLMQATTDRYPDLLFVIAYFEINVSNFVSQINLCI